jgi:RNA polymerase sigma-70 factor (ECF subfamily)
MMDEMPATRPAATALPVLLAELRPKLHRYCARMVGSAFDGEDVVQEAMTKAALAFGDGVAEPERWLFRIAHNTALDALRRKKREAARRSEAQMDEIADASAAADARVAAKASLAAFLVLPPVQRGAVILTDVLGHPMAETCEVLGVTEASGKAALHRGRAALRRNADTGFDASPILEAERARLAAYADRFNARDFDALRALLAEDVRLDLADRVRLAGRQAVGVYFTRYSENPTFEHARLCRVEGRLALAIRDPANGPDYVVLLDWDGARIAAIRDYRYAPYVGESVRIEAVE